ncbi:MCE family protein [Nocardioides daejeonensis]|uniref:MCE family protein n=1 Tax=Nocardioides daejeonensis TaxID=1046556 RepID=UPI000D741C0E|nr:MCE family protein [Nocardioides daejeonensis]
MRLRIIARGVAVAAALAVGATGCQIQPNDNTLPGQVAVGDDGYTVTVHFDQVENLVPNSTVQMDNVVIGTVAGIRATDWEAEVELRLLKEVEVPADAVFSIGQKTLLGAQFVEVSRSESRDKAPRLAEGAVVPVGQTGTYPSTEQVLGGVALLLNNGGLSQISTITGELSTALRDRVPDTRSLVRRTNELLRVLDDNRGDVVRALEALNRLSSGLAEDKDALVDAINRITPGLKALETERATLVDAVSRTGETGVRATQVVRASRQALLANLDSLRPVLDRLASVSTEIPEALKIGITVPFPAMTTHRAVQGDYANLFATLDLTTDHLLGSWIGPVDPALLGGDQPGDAAKTSKKSSTDKPSRKKSGDDRPPASVQPPAESSTSTCLLAFLGVC